MSSRASRTPEPTAFFPFKSPIFSYFPLFSKKFPIYRFSIAKLRVYYILVYNSDIPFCARSFQRKSR